jgi:protocatechuate 3,4-dioxygenase beta subunit
LAVAFLIAFATAAQAAVTSLTVNGQTSGTLATPTQLVMRANTSAAAETVRFVIGIDANQNGVLDAGEGLVEAVPIRDGAYNDESSQAQVVQFTLPRSNIPMGIWGRFVVAALGQDGSMVEHGYQMTGPSTSQTISGTVRDSAGNPVAGAMVNALAIDKEGFADEPADVAVTSPAGVFSMTVAPGQYEVMANLPNEEDVQSVPALYRFGLASGQSRTGLKFTLDVTQGAPYTIEGTLTGPGGEPVVEHFVTASSGSDWRGASTDIEGHYRLHVTSGTWTVSPNAVADRGYHYYSGSQQAVSVPPNKAGVNFSMSIASSYCSGRVTDQSAAAVPDAGVHAWTTPQQYDVILPCNAQGKYVLYLPAGTYHAGARGNVYGFDTAGNANFTVPPNATADFTLHTNSIAISGRVTRTDTAAGVPYAYVEGSGVSPQWQTWGGPFQSRTDSNGNYTLHVPPGQFQVQASSPILGSSQSQPVDATANRTGVNFALAVQNSAPTLSNGYVAPQSGAAGATFTFYVTYTDAQNSWPWQVYAFLDGTPRLMQQVDPGDTNFTDGAVFQCTWQPGAGSHTFSFGVIEAVSDWAANIVSLPTSGSFSGPTVAATGDPVVSITSPANGATVSATVNVTATASDADGIQKVEFYDGATLKSTDTSAPYQWSWDTLPVSVAEGWHTISARAYDNTGHTTQVSILVKVDNTTFDDVSKTSSQWPYVEALVREGITGGCSGSPPLYCPDSNVTRAAMAKFLCLAAGKTWLDRVTATFADVPKTHPFFGWIERLADSGSWGGTAPTGGCRIEGSNKYYCPNDPVTRQQMAKFLCVAAGKTWLAKPSATFADVPLTHQFFGWIERLAEPTSWGGSPVTGGCAGGPPRLYCPTQNVTRGQMAVFIVKAFAITL